MRPFDRVLGGLPLLLVPAIAGALWPKPAAQELAPQTLQLTPGQFSFAASSITNDILERAFIRYNSIIFNAVPPVSPLAQQPSAQLYGLNVSISDPTTTINFGIDESYNLTIPSDGGYAFVQAKNVFGALHGLERFSQLVDWQSGVSYVVPATALVDVPRFAHRGALLDTARHFLSLRTVLAFVDALAYNFMNVLHWHIVDDQSFPYVSSTFPNLSAFGAYNAPETTHTYSAVDVQTVIAYARDRGVMVMAEFDTPGHTLSWGLGQAGLLTQCYDTTGQPIAGDFGPIDPTLPTAWTFLKGLFTELTAVFPNQYLHLGGDEVLFDCWQSNPAIQKWMAAHGYGTNYALLENYYEQTLLDLVGGLNKSYIVWQEIFDNGLKIRPDTVVHAWKGGSTAAGLAELQKITAAGFRGILSAGWYLNYIAYGPTWQTYYQADPQNFTGTQAQKDLVVGGEFAVWAEYVDDNNIISRSWPFGSAIAERLWAPASTRDLNDASVRLHAHNCRMKSRGIAAEPANGPSFCPWEYVPAYNPPFALP